MEARMADGSAGAAAPGRGWRRARAGPTVAPAAGCEALECRELDLGDPADLGLLREHLRALSFEDRVARFYGVVSDQSIDRTCQAWAAAGVLAAGCVHGGRLVAAAVAGPGEGEEFDLGISVDAGWRRRGLGVLAGRRVVEACAERGVRAFACDTRAGNPAAIAMVRKLGFGPPARALDGTLRHFMAEAAVAPAARPAAP
jgi:ribosomal protein S18 acetylase RimI-like enzyme